MDYAGAIETGARLLSDSFGGSARLELVEAVYDYPGSPSTILRCKVIGGAEGSPATAIVKQSNENNESLLFDAAGLEFLDETVKGLAPHVYGIDIAVKTMVMEDLNFPEEKLLGNILFGDDSQYAEAALTALQTALARLHRATMGHKARFQAIRHRHGATSHSRHRIHFIGEALADATSRFQTMGVAISEAAKDDLKAAKELVENPGAFLCLVHGDATPANAFYDAGTIRLFDFEASDFRHALLDGSFSRLRYIHSVWAREIPQEVQRRLMAVYRDAFLAGTEIDEATFERAFVACCAGWMAGLCMLLPSVIDEDNKWGRATNRQRIVAGLSHFAITAEETGLFAALGEACRVAEARLRTIWTEQECTMRIYPAFA